MIVKRPTLLVDTVKARRNLQRIHQKIQNCGVKFRPHFKTHQSRAVGRWFRQAGIGSIAVSSLKMAEYFARDGWKDITLALPVNLAEIEDIRRVRRLCRLQLTIESPVSLDILVRKLSGPEIPVCIELDTGQHRSGIPATDRREITTLLRKVEGTAETTFSGFLIHDGHTYQAENAREVRKIYKRTVDTVKNLKTLLSREGITRSLPVSYGDTPSCSLVEDLSAMDEIRCGNFIYYDLMQTRLGACREGDIAVAVAAPVIAKNRQRREIVLYCGAVHLSKECLAGSDGRPVYGHIVTLEESGWSASLPRTAIRSISQEHAVISTTPAVYNRISRGDILGILPVHACLTVHLMRTAKTLEGELITTLGSTVA